MKTPAAALMMAIILASVFISIDSEVSEADSQYDEHWCYGNTVYLDYNVVGSEAEVTWTVYDENMVELHEEAGYSIEYDASERDLIYVKQLVELHGNSSEDVVKINLMHVEDEVLEGGDGRYDVLFLDDVDGEMIGYVPFTDETNISASAGESPVFVDAIPDDPVRDGYVFQGWWVEGADGTEYRYDPSMPVTSDITVYAKWAAIGSDGGSNGTIIIGQVNTVTFECSPGLTYEIVSTGSDSVTFTVAEMSGFDIVDGSITVTANGELLNGTDGTYVLSGINSDVLVEISGELASGNGGSDGDDGIPFWIWILILVIVLIVIAAILWMRSRKEDDQEQI